ALMARTERTSGTENTRILAIMFSIRAGCSRTARNRAPAPTDGLGQNSRTSPAPRYVAPFMAFSSFNAETQRFGHRRRGTRLRVRVVGRPRVRPSGQSALQGPVRDPDRRLHR